MTGTCETCIRKSKYKTCSTCKKDKLFEDFYRQRADCKDCRKIKQAEIYQRRKDKDNKVACECGGEYRPRSKGEHIKTKKHQAHIKNKI